MNNEVKVSDMDKFDENIDKLTSILNNSRTTKRAFSSPEIIDSMLLYIASRLAGEYQRKIGTGKDFDSKALEDIIRDYMNSRPEKINFPWTIYTGCLFSDNVEISKIINNVNPQEVRVDTKSLDGLFEAVASMTNLFLTHLVVSKLNIE